MSISFEEFLKQAYEALKAHDSGTWLPETFLRPYTHEAKKKLEEWECYEAPGMTFSSTWSMGGTSGSYTGSIDVLDSEPEAQDPIELDIILEKFIPSLSFLQYKGISREVLKRGEKRHRDYYGGSRTEGWKGFNIKDLYAALTKRNLI